MLTNNLQEIVVATGNAGKFQELADLLNSISIKAIFGKDLDLPEPVEDGDTFEANAIIKAEAASKITGQAVLADDSGFCVNALDDAPGIFSARWAMNSQGVQDFSFAMNKIEEQLTANNFAANNQPAWFGCAIALAIPERETKVWLGKCEGKIVWPPRGNAGFGYDPMFIPNDQPQNQSNQPMKTFGEMSSSEKHGLQSTAHGGLSHRARAFYKMFRYLQGN